MTLKRKIAKKTYTLRNKLGLLPDTVEEKILKDMKRRAGRRMKHLCPIFDNTSTIKKGDKILLTMGRDEGERIPYFIDYYRKLGFDHFIFIDNMSTIPMANYLEGMSDVSLWFTEDSYPDSKYGVDWVNCLLNRYGIGHWCLTVDLDEFFVYPHMEYRTLDELLLFLENNEKFNFFAPLIDMYPRGAISDAKVPSGESPLKYASYYDAIGYYYELGDHEELWLRGGPRCRAFSNCDFQEAPSLNKMPLILWSENCCYVASTHDVVPFKYNHLYDPTICYPTGALLHFKFTSNFQAKAEFAIEHKNHYNESREYNTYLERLKQEESLSLMSPVSKKYEGTKSLIDSNLMNTGAW